jgi:hypothetical protein
MTVKDRWRWDWSCSWWYRNTEHTFDVILAGRSISSFRKSVNCIEKVPHETFEK